MLRDYITFKEAWSAVHGRQAQATTVFLRFIERKFGARFLYDKSTFLRGRSDLIGLQNLAETMKQSGIIRTLTKNSTLVDEPPIIMWSANYGRGTAGGISLKDDQKALTATLAESLERYLWANASDWGGTAVKASFTEIKRRGEAVSPSVLSYLSSPDSLPPEAEYIWLKDASLVSKTSVWMPAQVVAPTHHRAAKRTRSEPILRELVSNGLATGESYLDAQLGGLLEILERDAFMITWLNQISPPRWQLSSLAERDPLLRELVHKCSQYLLKVHVVRLITDAPTHATMAIIEDTTSNRPRFSFGTAAGSDPFRNARHAILEALRARHNLRLQLARGGSAAVKNGRQRFWMETSDQTGLEFLIRGPVEKIENSDWSDDTKERHLERLLDWCRRQRYDCISFDLGRSRQNPTAWKVAFTAVPDLIPMNVEREHRYSSGSRLQTVPLSLGYEPLAEAWDRSPHPFL